MRLFVGVELPDPERERAAAAAADLRARIERAARAARLRWEDAAKLHVTLWFIGEVDDARAAAIRESLGRPFETPRFQLQLGGAGVFPPGGAPRVVWLGLRLGADDLASVHRELHDRLVPLGLTAESRPYSAHVTVARVREVAPAAARRIREEIARCRIDSRPCDIDAVTLFRSRLSPKCSQYEPLLRVPLKA
jgi:RNA 2',3'-cyclic 3'-phosphodiesterase